MQAGQHQEGALQQNVIIDDCDHHSADAVNVVIGNLMVMKARCCGRCLCPTCSPWYWTLQSQRTAVQMLSM